MKITAFHRSVLALGVVTMAGCQIAPDTSRTIAAFDNSASAAPKAREGQAIILGRDDVVVVGAMSAAQYQRHLSNLSRQFARQAPYEIFFAPGESALDDVDRDTLREQARWIIAHPEAFVSVTGFADDAGSPRQNKALGMARAREAVTYLVLQGVDRARLVALSGEDSSEQPGPAVGRKVVTAIYELVDSRPVDAGELARAAVQDAVVAGTPTGGATSGGTTTGGTTGGTTTGGGTTGGGTTGGGSTSGGGRGG